jgi:hypothetical protein
MKTAFTIAVLFIFLLGSMGMTITVHNCGGKLFSKKVSVLIKSNGGCGMEKSSGDCEMPHEDKPTEDCCKDEINNLKITDNFSPASFDWTPHICKTVVFEVVDVQVINGEKNPIPSDFNFILPPGRKNIPLFVQSFLC